MPTDQDKTIRKLRAILSADVKGYSLLMANDEAFTIKTLKAYRNIMSDLIKQHNGRVVDSPGDNVLAEFSSVVDAVTCATEVQKVLKVKNEELPDEKRLEFRIGVNIGDVVQDGDRIYGNGVNVAARIEGLAEPGGVSISRNAFGQIKDKLTFGYEYIGEHEVKNIKDPIRVYKVLMDPEDAGKLIGEEPQRYRKKWFLPVAVVAAIIVTSIVWHFYQKTIKPDIEPASIEKMALPLPDKPSIAVLAFTNMSGEKEQEYFCDGLSEGIINGLAKSDRLFVIARNSTFIYKGKPVKVKQVAEDLGVRYVLEGSIQKVGDKVRITAQLIDALSGHHLFSERYDRELKDILNLQDEITMKVLTAVQVKLTVGEGALVSAKGTKNLDAYLKVLQAREHKGGIMNKERVEKAMQLLEEAIALDPEYSYAYSILSTAHMDLVALSASDSPRESLRRSIELGNKAVALDESNPYAHANLAFPYMLLGEYDKGILEAEKGLSLAPNYAGGYFALGAVLATAGRHQEAIPIFKKCLRLSPVPVHSQVLGLLATSYTLLGQFEEAIATYKKVLHVYGPDQLPAHLGLAGTYAIMGREKEARAEGAEVMRIDPEFSVERYLKSRPYNQSRKDFIAGVLRKAGLPYTPPLPLPDKPSIAVLAFDNLSGDPEQEYFSDGITEEIISALSKTDQLFVIARNSSFIYKGKPVNVKQVSRELGVRYVLEGSVRISEDHVRITAQLIDATTGHHLWSERYDRDLKDIFALQDEITINIVSSLQIELTEGEQARMWIKKRAKNLDVKLKAMKLLSLWREDTIESHMLHGKLSQELIDMAPESPVGYLTLGWHHWYLALTLGKSPKENLTKASEMAQKVLSMDEFNADAYALLGSVYMVMRQHDKAIAAGKRSIELQPNGAMVHGLLGFTLYFAGQPDEGIVYLNKGIRLNPFPASWYFQHLGSCYIMKRQYEKALTLYKQALLKSPDNFIIHMCLANTYALLDRQKEADAAVKKVLELHPSFSIERFSATLPYKNQADLKFIADAMRKAGFPDKQQTALQDSPRKEAVSATKRNSNNVTIDLKGEWDTVYDLKEYGVSKDVVQITQEENKFVGIKLIGTQWSPKGSETIKGDVEDNRIKSMFLKTNQGWMPAEWIVNEQDDEILLKVQLESIGLTIDVKLTRK